MAGWRATVGGVVPDGQAPRGPMRVRRLAFRSIALVQSGVAWLANAGRTVPREYRDYTTWDLLKAHRVAQALRDGDANLDVGSGNAHHLRELALFRSFSRRVGLELTAPPPRTVPDVELGVYDGQTLPFPDRSFDAVIFGYVLHYLTHEHAVRLLAEACRVARCQVLLLEDSLPHFSVLYRLRNRLERVKSDLLYAGVGGQGYRPARNEQMFLTLREWVALLEALPPVASVRIERLDTISVLMHHTMFDVSLR
jgi:SAM-dependent methyltransferase